MAKANLAKKVECTGCGGEHWHIVSGVRMCHACGRDWPVPAPKLAREAVYTETPVDVDPGQLRLFGGGQS